MTAALIITLRETLEAALVAGIVLAYLDKTENDGHKKFAWWGVLAGALLSALMAWVFEAFLGGFEGRAEEIYEGVTMIVAAGLLTWMILWMLNQRSKIKANLEGRVEAHISGDHPWGIFLLVFVGVLREGIETVIFLQAATQQSGGTSVFVGGLIGVVLAVVLAWMVFKGVMKVSLKKFFTVTSVLLILFAAGLLAHGVHEFQEAGLLPGYVEQLWDTNGFVDEGAGLGSFLKGLFGYNGNPSLLEVVSYLAYLAFIALAWRRIAKKA